MIDGLPVPDLEIFDDDDEPEQIMFSPLPSSMHRLTEEEFDQLFKLCRISFQNDFMSPLKCTSNSAVYKVTSIDNEKSICYKITDHIKRVRDEFARIQMMEKEKINSPYFVKTISYFEIPTKAMIQMELCEKGDISDIIFEEPDIWYLIHDIGMALQILHSHELMHLDVSPGNILMTNDGHFKLADFGTLTKINHFTEGDEGAGPYVSPEALAYPNGIHLVTTATDIFSFGVVLMEAVTGKNAPRGGSQGYAKLRKGEIGVGHGIYQTNCTPELRDLINSMMRPNPSERPSAEWIVNVSCSHCN